MNTPRNLQPWVVMKFGGTSVSTGKNWQTIEELVRNSMANGEQVLVVHSALSQVSNRLEQAIIDALQQRGLQVLEEITQTHIKLAKELNLDGEPLIADSIKRLHQWLSGIALVGEVSPRIRAQILAEGEIMATALGAARLKAANLSVELLDARQLLQSTVQENASENGKYLSAICQNLPDEELAQKLQHTGSSLILTQGFIASNSDAETVLLGRGGSDVSGAVFAAKLQAKRLEIWTDVPGMFSTDPKMSASARLLKDISYDEAQEIALMGAKVVHPRALPPVRRAQIPVLIKCTLTPDAAGTRISNQPADTNARVKAITVKQGLILVSMTSSAMSGESGFLAKAFSAFAANDLSIDLVSTSEASVTVSLDIGQNPDEKALQQLHAELAPLCRVSILRNCASVSVVGRGIRTILHKLTPALELFREHPVRLVSQAANNLNFTVVVDEDQAQKLASRLHDELVEVEPEDKVFGEPWQEARAAVTRNELPNVPWWTNKKTELLQIKPKANAVYVYDLETVQERARSLMALQTVSRVFYAMKANSNPKVLQTIAKQGLGIECVSLAEIEHALATVPGLKVSQILFTPNFAPRHEYEAAIKLGTILTLDNIHPLQNWPEIFAGSEVLLRVDPERSRGHHRHVQTAGARAKFGIPIEDLAEVRELAQSAGLKIIGLHAHAGSGIMDPDHWRDLAELFSSLVVDFTDLRIFNLGGGLGVPDSPGIPSLDLEQLDENLALVREACPYIDLWLEPGRFLVAESGVLLASVTQTKAKGTTHYVGLETGMNSLIRPALYGSRHEIVNLTRLGDEAKLSPVSVVGPICESADVLGIDRYLPPTVENDVILIANAGAYGAVMGSRYNLRDPAKEITLKIVD